MKWLLLLGAILGFTSAASAVDTKSIREDWEACNLVDPSNAGLKQCAGEAYRAADDLLNVTYQIYLKRLQRQKDASSKEVLRRLVNAEVAWIKYKETNCVFSGIMMLGGTGESLVIGGCLANETLKRVDELNSVLNGGR